MQQWKEHWNFYDLHAATACSLKQFLLFLEISVVSYVISVIPKILKLSQDTLAPIDNLPMPREVYFLIFE